MSQAILSTYRSSTTAREFPGLLAQFTRTVGYGIGYSIVLLGMVPVIPIVLLMHLFAILDSDQDELQVSESV